MTPDTAALRAYVLSVVGELKYGDQEPEVAADAIMVRVDRALCDAADEVERLRADKTSARSALDAVLEVCDEADVLAPIHLDHDQAHAWLCGYNVATTKVHAAITDTLGRSPFGDYRTAPHDAAEATP